MRQAEGSRRYRYYIGETPIDGRTIRIPAAELEGSVAHCLASAVDDPLGLCAKAWLEVAPDNLALLSQKAEVLAASLRQRDRSALAELVRLVRVLDDRVELECATTVLAEALGARVAHGAPDTLTLVSPVSLRRTGRAVRLVQASGATLETQPAVSLVKLLVKARRWWTVLRAGEVDITRLAEAEGVTASYMTRVVRLAFLSPAMVEAILAGRTRAEVDGGLITASQAIAASWAEQAKTLLPA
ncbi:hypothetical protein [Altererythrobacter sp. Root672]|uniref:hypothetical protein n=1 Tax=Altererythrobacter sp. Root672 TaxID=1736584 RepID=UPI0006F75CF1|nr:hypothetical protein [Altererythrobacter sp. Root672]KRA79717.1 hypothetical protein ASD76_16975 [Altererythrobacter sp. Root672]